MCDLFYDIDDPNFEGFAHILVYQTWDLFLGSLKEVLIKYMTGFININFLKGNSDKYHLIVRSKTPVGIEVSNITKMSEEKVKFLGIIKITG